MKSGWKLLSNVSHEKKAKGRVWSGQDVDAARASCCRHPWTTALVCSRMHASSTACLPFTDDLRRHGARHIKIAGRAPVC